MPSQALSANPGKRGSAVERRLAEEELVSHAWRIATWPNAADHSKWAVSDDGEWACFADLNHAAGCVALRICTPRNTIMIYQVSAYD